MACRTATRIAAWGLAVALAACQGGGSGPPAPSPPPAPPPPAGSPGALALAAASYAVGEGAGSVLVEVVREGGTQGAVSAELATADGSATAPADYAATAVTVSFADGEGGSKAIAIAIADDALHEPDESFTVSLAAPGGGASLGAVASATVAIADDDPAALPEVPPPARPAARARSTADGSCDGVLDYGDELRVSNARVVGRTYPATGAVELDLELDLQNSGNARFLAASATVDPAHPAAAALGLLASPPQLPADFGAIAGGALATSAAPLRLRLPAAREGELLEQLRSGALPLHVDADEENLLAPGVRVLAWPRQDDELYQGCTVTWGLNHDPGPGPFALGAAFSVCLFHPSAEVSTVFDDFVPGSLVYLQEDAAAPGGPLLHIPQALRKVRIVDVVRTEPTPPQHFTFVTATVRIPNDEPLPEIFSTASHCTGRKGHVDPAVQASRVYVLDGRPVADLDRDADGQPIRVNELLLSSGMISFSGQVSGHALKPSLDLRLRDGQVDVHASIENELSLTAEVRATAGVPEGVENPLDPAPVTLWTLCYPLPPLSIGPLETPRSILLSMTLAMEGSIGGGVQVGLQKRYVSGLSFHCTRRPGEAAQCSAGSHWNDGELELTPPQLTESTGFLLKPKATFQALARYGDDLCQTGPGIGLDASAYGKVGQALAQDPWWVAAYGVELAGFVDLKIAGLDVARFEAPLWSLERAAGDSSSSTAAARAPAAAVSPPPAPQAATPPRRSGEDQRWSVAIDDTGVPNGVNRGGVLALPDGSALAVASEPIGGRNPLVRLDRYGALAWVRKIDRKVLRIRGLPDGTALVLGTPSWMARVDADGALLWSREVVVGLASPPTARCVLADVAALEPSPGVYEYLGVGSINTSSPTRVDACAFRVREDGTVAWARSYAGELDEAFSVAIAARDGDLVAVGTATWQWVGARRVPLFARLDPGSGDVRWSRRLPLTRLVDIHDAVEAADGTLFAAGAALGTIRTTGAALLARLGADGTDGRHALLFEDADWEARLDADWLGRLTFAPWVDTAAGNTAIDAFQGLALSGDGLVAVGTTGLGVESAARAVKVNANLGVEWMTVFDTSSADVFTGVSRGGDALLVSGYSQGLPQAGGGASDNQLWVTKLPLTGSLDFLAAAGVTRRYVSPGVRSSHDDPLVNPSGEAVVDTALAPSDLLVLGSTEPTGLLLPTSAYCALLLTPSGRVSTADACPD